MLDSNQEDLQHFLYHACSDIDEIPSYGDYYVSDGEER